MTWYWVSATFKAIHSGPPRRRHRWEQIVFLIRAADAEDAARIAQEVARGKEHGYRGATGTVVTWKLQQIDRIEALFDREIRQGTEVYWRFFERVDPAPPKVTPELASPGRRWSEMLDERRWRPIASIVPLRHRILRIGFEA
jgi:hypothetical protein